MAYNSFCHHCYALQSTLYDSGSGRAYAASQWLLGYRADQLKESLVETARELETLISGYIQTVPEPESAFVEQRSTTGPLTSSPALFVRPPISRKTRSWKNIRYLLLALVLLVGIGLLIRYAPHSLTPTSNQATTTNNALLDHPYTAAVPGPGCDAGGANWLTGEYYKAPVTPTASTATTPVRGTPTLQVITDNSTAHGIRNE